MAYFVASIFLVWSGLAFAVNPLPAPSNFTNTEYIQAFTASGAGSNHNSNDSTDATALGKAMNARCCRYLSFQCTWAAITGTNNATVALESSDNGGTTWTAKTNAIISMSGASGNGEVSLTNATERDYRLVYTAGTVSAGTLNCWVSAK